MSIPHLRRVAAGFVLAGLLGAAPARAVSVPAQFVVENAVAGAAFQIPTGMAFLTDGRFLVAEKRGVVWMVRNGSRLATPVWSAETEVLDSDDRGLLGVAVDPAYFVNHFVYFLYVVDPDTDGVDTNPHGFGRLTRYRMNTSGDTNTVALATRTVLMGHDWRHGPLSAGPSHAIGSLRWGEDGSLLVSAGDGASYSDVDAGGLHPNAFGAGRTDPAEDIGAFRCQDLTSLCGKILRLNPANGHGYASNPYDDADLNSARSKVWAYGLRNAFRFTVRPGTGSADTAAGDPGILMAGDVGWNTWEELEVATAAGQNFGWPCREGPNACLEYQAANPAHNGCGSVGSGTNPAPWRNPAASWHHSNPSLSQPPGVAGICAVGGVFYTDTLYPAGYRTRYFYADYGAQWIRVASFDNGNNLLAAQDFGGEMDAPVDLATDPINGNLHYVSITTGEIRRIRYTGAVGGNTPPVASITAVPSSGIAPLSVAFSGAGSYDADGDSLTYAWTFGDGGISTQRALTHLYSQSGAYVAVLTVDDGRGGQHQASVAITVGTSSAFPTSVVLDAFNRADGALGGSWVGDLGALAIQSNAMVETGATASVVWNGASFGPDQECYITMATVTPAADEIDLMLKVHGASWNTGHIEVRYNPVYSRVTVSTYHPVQGWQERGVLEGVVFNGGDRFGARAFANGLLEVFKNGVALGRASLLGWAFASDGGSLGLTMTGATATRFDDFGGGNWSPSGQAPQVTLNSPNGGEVWAAGIPQPVMWTATDDIGVTAVDVYYRDSTAAPWMPLGLDLSNTGSFTWYVPNTPGTHTRVRVVARDGSGNAGADSSNAEFSITGVSSGRVATTLRDFREPGTQPLQGGSYSGHNTCYVCHGGYDPAVEPGHDFRGSSMAQAARDPLFYACLAIAERDAPSSGDLCIRCHAPLGWLSGKSQPTSGARIDAASRDGVNCDFCHRMVDPIVRPGVNPAEDSAVVGALKPAHRPTGYGNGQYVMDPNVRRRGPFTDPATPHAFLASSFHSRSEYCATCHDVSNPALTREGPARYAAGPLDAPADSISALTLMPLERTYSEWKKSAFPAGVFAPLFAGNAPGGIVASCQDCHLRDATGRGCFLAGVPLRTNLPLHDMMGGNAWIGSLVSSLYPAETDAGALADGSARALAMLQLAATVDLSVASQADSFLATVTVTNHTGHKLPTGFPEGRRLWLNLVARNAGGNVVYESGAYDAATGILSQTAGTRVYEAKLGLSSGSAGGVGLTAGPSFHFALNDTIYQDNRIPPAGFTGAAYQTFGGAPVEPGLPAPRYADGQNWDVTAYRLPATARTVSATLYYQTASKEYVEFLRDANTTNTAGQVLYDAWTSHGRSAPVAMARDSVAFAQVDAPPGRAPVTLSLRVGSNPFQGRLELILALPKAARVDVDLLDVTGRLVATLTKGPRVAGEHRLAWDGRAASGRDAGPGVFWAVARVDGFRLVRRVVRLR